MPPPDGFATDASAFFGSGGVDHPCRTFDQAQQRCEFHGTCKRNVARASSDAAPAGKPNSLFPVRVFAAGDRIDALVAKYSADPAGLLSRSSAAWKADGVARFSTPAEPWAERETSWHNYYLRSNLTYDSFFREHIISQGHVYQYVIGFQGAARDPLQHTLPFIFSKPETARAVIRYTLKEIQADGSIPYGIVEAGCQCPPFSIPATRKCGCCGRRANTYWPHATKAFSTKRFPSIRARWQAPRTRRSATCCNVLTSTSLKISEWGSTDSCGSPTAIGTTMSSSSARRQHRRPDPVKVKSVSKPGKRPQRRDGQLRPRLLRAAARLRRRHEDRGASACQGRSPTRSRSCVLARAVVP